jgi:hypothetical protein
LSRKGISDAMLRRSAAAFPQLAAAFPAKLQLKQFAPLQSDSVRISHSEFFWLSRWSRHEVDSHTAKRKVPFFFIHKMDTVLPIYARVTNTTGVPLTMRVGSKGPHAKRAII